MEISTNNTIYSSASTSQTTSNTQNVSNTFNTLLNNQSTTSEPTKKETFRVVAFIDKYRLYLHKGTKCATVLKYSLI